MNYQNTKNPENNNNLNNQLNPSVNPSVNSNVNPNVNPNINPNVNPNVNKPKEDEDKHQFFNVNQDDNNKSTDKLIQQPLNSQQILPMGRYFVIKSIDEENLHKVSSLSMV